MLIFLFIILFLLLCWRRLDWAMMILIIALPAYLIRFNVFGIPTTLLESMIWSAFLAWFIRNFSNIKNNFLNNFKKQERIKKINYPFYLEIILLLIISFIAVAIVGFNLNSLGIWKAYFFDPILFFILVLNIFNNKAGKEKILLALMISALLVSLVAIFQKITGAFIFNEFWAVENTRRVVSFFGYPNAVGLYIGPLVLVMVGWLSDILKNFQDKKLSFKLFIGLVIIISVLAIYFAKSEGAILGVVVGLIIFGLFFNKKIRLATLLLVIIFSCCVYVYSPVKNFLINKISLSDLSGQIRQQQWRETFKMLKNGRIISGVGLANYKKTILPYHQEGIFFNSDNDPDFHYKTISSAEYRKTHWQPTEIYLYPHNIFLNFWSELGLAGMLLFIWIIVKCFYLGIFNFLANVEVSAGKQFSIFKQIQNYKEYNYKYLNIGLMCAMVVIVIHGLVDVPYFKNDLATMFWLLIAMMSLINFEIKYEKNI